MHCAQRETPHSCGLANGCVYAALPSLHRQHQQLRRRTLPHLLRLPPAVRYCWQGAKGIILHGYRAQRDTSSRLGTPSSASVGTAAGKLRAGNALCSGGMSLERGEGVGRGMETWNSYFWGGTQVPTPLDIHKQAQQKLQRQPGYNNPGSFIPPQTPRRQGLEPLREGARASMWNIRGAFPSEGAAVCACRTCRRHQRCQSRLAYSYSDG